MKKDKTTNLDTEMYKKWISDPESVKDILKAPRPIALNRHAAKGRRFQTLAAQGKLVETLVKEPLQGYMGKRLTALYVELGERCHVAQSEDKHQEHEEASSKKRKSRSEDKEEEEEQMQVAGDEFGMIEMDMPEVEMHHTPQQARASEAHGQPSSSNGFAGFEMPVEEDEGEEAVEVDPEAENRLSERAKKAIVMLQNEYSKSANPKHPLSYNKIMQPANAPKPSRTQAAVAFFELLHLHAKGYVKLNQPSAYSDIAISQTEKLSRFSCHDI